jgi:hypothetical protein
MVARERFEIYVRSYPDGETVSQVSTDGGIEPVWPSRGTDLAELRERAW